MQNHLPEIVKLKNWMLVGTFFALWISVYFNTATEEVLAYILILSFGILHGSNDIKLIRATSGNKKVPGMLRVLLYYLTFIGVVIGLLKFFPLLLIGIFLIFSAYHFGEQHWNGSLSGSKVSRTVLYVNYGLLVLTVLFQAHGSEVENILLKLTNFVVPAAIWNNLLLFFLFIFVIHYLLLFKQKISSRARELIILLVLFVVFNTASLLWSFAIYFIIWHSVPSLSDQIQYLYGELSWKNFLKYFKTSFWYWVVAVTALVLLFLFFSKVFEEAVPLLFAFIIAITFPHVMVIEKLRRS
ncbi:MAG: Brp/Blh family beta-carotene 15,15'-dioxygenase [Bacteroidota bacterium]